MAVEPSGPKMHGDAAHAQRGLRREHTHTPDKDVPAMDATLVNGFLVSIAVLFGIGAALGPFIALAIGLALRGDRDRALDHAAATARLAGTESPDGVEAAAPGDGREPAAARSEPVTAA